MCVHTEKIYCTTDNSCGGEHYSVHRSLGNCGIIAFWPDNEVEGATGFNMNLTWNVSVLSECVHVWFYIWIPCLSMHRLIHEWNETSLLEPLFFCFTSVCVCDDCVCCRLAPCTDSLLFYGRWPKRSGAAIIDEVHSSIIQPYIWLANRNDDQALHWILTSIRCLALGCCYLYLPCLSAFSFFVFVILSVAAFFPVGIFFFVCAFIHCTLKMNHCLTLFCWWVFQYM